MPTHALPVVETARGWFPSSPADCPLSHVGSSHRPLTWVSLSLYSNQTRQSDRSVRVASGSGPYRARISRISPQPGRVASTASKESHGYRRCSLGGIAFSAHLSLSDILSLELESSAAWEIIVYNTKSSPLCCGPSESPGPYSGPLWMQGTR